MIIHPMDSIKLKIAQYSGKQFALTDEQKNAKHKAGYRLFNYHVGRVTGVLDKVRKDGEVKEWMEGYVVRSN